MRLGVDIGGTFTDLVLIDQDGEFQVGKVLTTPDDHVLGIREGLQKLSLSLPALNLFLHGSTIAINTVIERKGARTGLITTKGFRDIYEIGRGNRPDAYNIHFQRPRPLVPRDLRVEVCERISAQGEILIPLDETSLEAAVKELEIEGVQSVAVCLLHSYANPIHEQKIGEYIATKHPDWYVSLSHQVVREIREYERTSTTVLNAYIAPIVGRYIGGLEEMLEHSGYRGKVFIMQSNGGVMAAKTARITPVTMMESGPVAGVMGAAVVGKALGYSNVISFDMGGTTAKASLIRHGELEVTTMYYIGGYATGHPIMLPVVDIVEVGAGGGSIAWIDDAGALKVGPHSAGAQPGPACFARGGAEPTVTDANVVLGRIDPEHFLKGKLHIDRHKAAEAIARVAQPLGMSITEAALGIVTIADASMALAIRAVSVQRGRDPRDFVLVLSGGGGPLHGVGIARDLSIPIAIVPQRSAVFSAIGLLNAELRHDYVQTVLTDLQEMALYRLDTLLDQIESEAARTLESEGATREATRFVRLLDLRYVGQEHTLSVPVETRLADIHVLTLRERFDALHLERYGHSAPSEPVQVVNVRLQAMAAPGERISFAAKVKQGSMEDAFVGTRQIILSRGQPPATCPVFDRNRLPVGAELQGPAAIEEYGCTTLLYPGDVAVVSPQGHLVIHVCPANGVL